MFNFVYPPSIIGWLNAQL